MASDKSRHEQISGYLRQCQCQLRCLCPLRRQYLLLRCLLRNLHPRLVQFQRLCRHLHRCQGCRYQRLCCQQGSQKQRLMSYFQRSRYPHHLPLCLRWAPCCRCL
ncbi:hypothetical protein ASE31_20660 [Acidovorax sp. Root217]|nr:hypothetical protein ASE31_20660 [Acidovorax sp. Root217]